MRLRRWMTATVFATVLVTVCFAGGDPVAGEKLFEEQCAGCHSIGEGDLVGPDLKGVAERRSREWLRQVIHHPDEQSGDPARKQLQQTYEAEMPELGLSEAEVDDLLAFLSGGGEERGATSPSAGSIGTFSKEDRARGDALFSGKTALKNGGPPCAACHARSTAGQSGGNLAVDLARERTRNAEAVFAMVKNARFPLMKPIYERHPLSDDEARALTAFLMMAGDDRPSGERDAGSPVHGAGVMLVVLVAAVVGLTWRKSDEEVD